MYDDIERQLVESNVRVKNGRYEIPVPLKTDVLKSLPNNYSNLIMISYFEVLPVNITKMLFSTFFYLTFRLAIDARLHQKTAIQGESAP